MGRSECQHDFDFNSFWLGKFHSKKRVRPIFVEEADAIVVITVYVYFLTGD